MIQKPSWFFAALLLVSLPAGAHLAAGKSLAPMLERVTPGVVNIATRTRLETRDNPLLRDPFFRRFFDLPERQRQRESQSLGSGVIVDARKGYVLTNHHVIDKADQITVTLADGRQVDAKLVGSDSETDIAVIQIPAEGLSAVPIGNSDRLRVGDYVVAIGNPFGLGQTVTSGIISALGRSGLGIEGYEDFIQTDASINPGNSGGALVNLDGQLIGINTAIVGPSGGNVGIGFAIPALMARSLMEQIVAHGSVRRGRLGVSVQDLTPELAEAFNLRRGTGAVLAQVERSSPAEKAGLQPGDVVTAVNGRPVDSAADLRNAVGLVRAGQQIELDILRNGRAQKIAALVEEPKALEADALSELLGGITLGELDSNHPLRGRGVLIKRIAGGSPAARTGLRPGDVIVSVNRQPVTSLDEFQAVATQAGGQLLLNVQRGSRAFFLMLR